jgi:hypothetical protein
MATPTAENPVSVCSDKVVCTLGEFPELTKAVRDGDLATVSILCAQLFDLNSETKVPLPTAKTKGVRP